jgi:hypothetical protein
MPAPVPPDPEPPSEITLEEWIASCQSCCGIEPKSVRTTQSIAGDLTEERVESGEKSSPS